MTNNLLCLSLIVNIVLGWVLIYMYLKKKSNQEEESTLETPADNTTPPATPVIHVIFDQERDENTPLEIAEVALDYKEYFFSNITGKNSMKKNEDENEEKKVYCYYRDVDWSKIFLEEGLWGVNNLMM